jgi:hypothetical protein
MRGPEPPRTRQIMPSYASYPSPTALDSDWNLEFLWSLGFGCSDFRRFANLTVQKQADWTGKLNKK